MAGHSHWAGIKHRKAAQDAKRSKHFSRFSKALMLAAREGGSDPEKNLALRYAVDRAKAGNMPNDSIARAIKKGAGELGDVQFHEITYEGYAAGGVGILVEVVTDNRNRTAPEMRSMFSKHGGNLGTPGSVGFMFDRKGLLGIPVAEASEEEVLEVALEAGAEDVEAQGDQVGVTTSPTDFITVKGALAEKGWTLTTAELAYVPQNTVTPDADTCVKVEKLLALLDEHDDVQGVHSNYAPADE